MNELVIGGLAIGAALLLARPEGGVVVLPTLGAGAAASSSSLPRKVCGVDWTTAHGVDLATAMDPINVLLAQWRGLVATFGVDPNSDVAWAASSLDPFAAAGSGTPLPLLGTNCLREVCDQWLAALRAGMAAAPLNLSLAICSSAAASNEYLSAAEDGRAPMMLLSIPQGGCANRADAMEDVPANWTGLTPLGHAACQLAAWRKALDSLDPSLVGTSATLQTYQLLVALAGEMSGADVVPSGYRATDNTVDVAGAFGAAGDAVAKFVGGGLGQIAGSVVGSGLFWAAALGFVAWKVIA